ncbi:MAG: DUF1573 domain-containing protein [Planctomycetota bacterium]|jgi:hypothetical protein
MKRKIRIQASQMICVICGLALFLLIGCQKQLEVTEKNPPEIEFKELVYDFGEVGPSAKQKGQFEFKNVGEGLLKITKVGRCCGVVTRIDKMEYAPGESGTLHVEWTSGPLESKMSRQLFVHSNDKTNPQTALTIKAKTVLKVAWEPKRLRLFLDEDNAGCPKITISSIDDRPFSITGFKSTADCITTDFDPKAEKTEFVLEPKIDAEKLKKSLKGRVNITLNHPQGKNATILYSVLPKYTVNPPLLIMFNAKPETPIVRTISVLNNYKKDFEIESLTSKSNIVDIEILEQKKISNGYQIEVAITPPAAEGKTKFTDQLSVSIKDGEKLPIRCNGYYTKRKAKAQTQQSTLEESG